MRQALAPYAIAVTYIEVLPNATARGAWEARMSADYGRDVVLSDANGSAVQQAHVDGPCWGVSYAAGPGSNGTLVCPHCAHCGGAR